MKFLKKRRQELKMSQQTFAQEMNVDRSTVAKWETGTWPRADKLVSIAKILGCSVDDLLRDEDDSEAV